jgi:FtsP/CotA-like multicopper oxidase with cupredoxin domain
MRLRFINMSAFATIIIYFSGQVNFRVMEIDSVIMDKDYMSFGQAIELNAGQRISIIIDPAQNNFQNFNIYSTIGMSNQLLYLVIC